MAIDVRNYDLGAGWRVAIRNEKGVETITISHRNSQRTKVFELDADASAGLRLIMKNAPTKTDAVRLASRPQQHQARQ